MNEENENKNPKNISIVKGNGIEISEVKDNLTFEEHKEKPNNIVIPVTQEHVDINQTPDLQTSNNEDNQNEESDDFTVSDATSSGAQHQEQNTDTTDDDFDNILNNQNND